MLRILSEIEPARGSASAEILKRHLDALGEPYEYIGLEHPALQLGRGPQRVFNIARRAFPRWGAGFENGPLMARRLRGLARAKLEPADLVVALAHGRLGMQAWRHAQDAGLPLVTFFHDWWPEMVRAYAAMLPGQYARVEADFVRLQRASRSCLCVCEGMAAELHPAASTRVLLPIPDRAVAWRADAGVPSEGPLRVAYTGSLWGVYGKLLQALAEALRHRPEIRLEIHGERRYLDPDFVAWAEPAGVLHPFLPYEEYLAKIRNGVDVLIGVMGLGEERSRRMRTSFPSKVANYFRTGNAVLLWADPESSLGRFCASHEYPWWVAEAEVGAVVDRLLGLARNRDMLGSARQASATLGEREFAPDRLQGIFVEALDAARKGERS